MDGRSMVPLLLTGGGNGSGAEPRTGTGAFAGAGAGAGAAGSGTPWRNMFLNEYTGLAAWPSSSGKKRLNDCPNNTYRALRYRNTSGEPGMLYAEFTAAPDWQFDAVDFRELYDLSTDPFQLHNLWPNASDGVRAKYRADMDTVWGCKGTACP